MPITGTRIISIHHPDLSRSCQRLTCTANPIHSTIIKFIPVTKAGPTAIGWSGPYGPMNCWKRLPHTARINVTTQYGWRLIRPRNENKSDFRFIMIPVGKVDSYDFIVDIGLSQVKSNNLKYMESHVLQFFYWFLLPLKIIPAV